MLFLSHQLRVYYDVSKPKNPSRAYWIFIGAMLLFADNDDAILPLGKPKET
jgi:hypothetical protein